MKLKHWLVLPLTLTTLMTMTACEEEEQERVAAAQQCLNEMTDTMTDAELTDKAEECREIMGEATTPEGYIIYCSSYFLEERFFGEQIIEAFDRSGDEENDGNDLTNVVSTFAFQSTENAALADEACSQTEITTYATFGGLAQMATTIGDLGGLDLSSGEIPTLTEFEDALANIDTAEEYEALGESAVSLAESVCGDDDDEENEICPTLDAATATGSNEIVGQCLSECMLGTTAPGNPCSVEATVICP
jgi:hypothetical protein